MTDTVARNPGKSVEELIERFPFATFSERFNRVREFEKYSDDYRNWTFWTYLKRAAKAFGAKGDRIPRQISNFPEIMRKRVEAAILDAHRTQAKFIE